MKKLLNLLGTVALFFTYNAYAGSGSIYPVQIESVAVIAIGSPYNNHIAGNMEIKILNGFTLPPSVSCDTTYITTKKTIDPDRSMFSLLSDAKNLGKDVKLHITNDSNRTAYPGRCSLIAVEIL